jgi:hypothetical protein
MLLLTAVALTSYFSSLGASSSRAEQERAEQAVLQALRYLARRESIRVNAFALLQPIGGQ